MRTIFVAPRPGPPQNPAFSCMLTLAIEGTIPKQIFEAQEIFHDSGAGRRHVKLWRQSAHLPGFQSTNSRRDATFGGRGGIMLICSRSSSVQRCAHTADEPLGAVNR